MLIRILLSVFVLSVTIASPAAAQWSRVNMNWKVSCSVDPGSYKKAGPIQTFRTSSNRCTGGIFKQRSEISGSDIRVNERVTYLFETTVSMVTSSQEPFVVFQIHDGRNGCAPPMSLRWQPNGTLNFDSDYTQDKGMAGCSPNTGLRNAQYYGPRLKREGTPHKLQVFLEFDGQGSFEVNVVVDGRPAISGNYMPPPGGGFVRSSRFYMKHGVYSQQFWPYEMRSEGMRVLKRK